MNDHVHSSEERPLIDRRRDGVVNDSREPMLARDRNDLCDVSQNERGIGRRLEIEHLGGGAERPQIVAWVRGVDIRDGDTERLQELIHELESGRVNGLRGNDVISRFHDREQDWKSTRLNSSHRCISYAVFCLKNKKL